MAMYPVRGIRNNNPGNLRRDGTPWQGLSSEQTDAEFYQFVDAAHGVRALGHDLATKIGRGYDTIEKIITRYAPPPENDTAAYIASVVNSTMIAANVRVARSDIPDIARAIIKHENGVVPYSQADITEWVFMP